jgi:hypothetical protein
LGGTRFVIGCVGDTNPIDSFIGKVRSVRISEGERFITDFAPDEPFDRQAENATILHYSNGTLEDISGHNHHGVIRQIDAHK